MQTQTQVPQNQDTDDGLTFIQEWYESTIISVGNALYTHRKLHHTIHFSSY